MKSWSGPQALTVVVPVREGHSVLLDERLEAERAALGVKLARVTSLHCGRLALVPRLGARSDVLLFESNFDGELETHLDELVAAAGGELGALLEHCEDHGGSLAARLRYGSRRTGALFCAHHGLAVARIRADARLRRAFRAFLRQERERLRSLGELGIVAEAQAHLRRDFGPELFFEEPERPAQDGALARAVGLSPLLVRSALADVGDLLSELWTDAKLDVQGIDARLERIAAGDRVEQRALTLVVELKPGRFRRRALAAALRFADGWLRSAPSLGSSHFARWVELGGGRLAFLSHHDQSFEAELGKLVEELGFVTSLIWSHTRDFPPSFGALFGGTRDEARFKQWAQAKRVPTAIAYRAYPELSVSDVARGRELLGILAGKLDEQRARRALELV